MNASADITSHRNVTLRLENAELRECLALAKAKIAKLEAEISELQAALNRYEREMGR